ncbi:Cytochrome C oxidase, cbb3-type, subunit III [Pustulibacterium marinum]|uniref:Cytochrome C oxidase, cbb3-type, subunit III n=1 Tax=Pustulibacterium marinum TaxID=1224947 RepID=A0A1I7HAG2_9FLAO|nr:cytochrome c [Pustulibacterium marinum]SFU57678.1 Cytochrome C oxidase, cbb3-type, subunit III [Pustulibacterium marinum]
MKSLFKIGIVLGVAASVTSCFNSSKPNYQYFPNMYEGVSYETYQESDAFPNDKEAQLPPANTIKRGWLPYDYENTTEGYDLAKVNLHSPLDSVNMEADMAKGKELFTIYCAICHGDKGDGNGTLVEREKFLGVPNYADRDISEGSVYHVIYYGLNSMGSYAVQLNEKERWQVAEYVMSLKTKLSK